MSSLAEFQKESTETLKYLQLAEYINHKIQNEELVINDRLPSVNQLMKLLKMSKETVLKGLNYLSEKGVIESVYRKGFYVRKKERYKAYRVCLIMDKMNLMRNTLYQAFVEKLKTTAEVDVFFHHHNIRVFEKLVSENLNNYTHFVIVTFFKEAASDIINQIPPQKRIVIDYNEKKLSGNYTCIYQDFESDIYDSLKELLPQLKKYQRIVLIAPTEAYHGKDVIKGFKEFCKDYRFENKIYNVINESQFTKGDAYITFSRYDLDDIDIIKLTNKHNWKLGEDIGLISYNDSAVKEVLENGITVITTDFVKMGEMAAISIINREVIKMRDNAKVILRNSL